MPYYVSNSFSKENSLVNQIKEREKVFFDYSLNKEESIPMLPSNSLSLVIAILTNISLFYILKPYVLINIIYMITIPLFQA